MHDVINKLVSIEKEIQKKNNRSKIIAVSKTFPMSNILPLINHGHKDFGENKVQEAMKKWTSIKQDFTDIKLHMVGKLQTNKVKYLLPLFDYIHSLDNLKLAEKISSEEKKTKKKVKIFIQVNIGNEPQKAGIAPENLKNFLLKCTKELNLNIIGLMCLPPNSDNSSIYFNKMNQLLKQTKLSELSMGMSNDYLDAVEQNATFIRIGSKIFGLRN
jgi:PLP dependent protein